MFKKTGDGIIDLFLNWFLADTGNACFDTTNWDSWLNNRAQYNNETVEEKKKEFYLYCDGHLAKVRFEALLKKHYAQLRVVILEVDGRLILPEEQEQKNKQIISLQISQDDQRLLMTKALANFGINGIKNMGIVSEDFARNYARFLRLQAGLYQESQERSA